MIKWGSLWYNNTLVFCYVFILYARLYLTKYTFCDILRQNTGIFEKVIFCMAEEPGGCGLYGRVDT